MNIRRLLGAGVIWLGMSVPAIASLVIKNVETVYAKTTMIRLDEF